jgi:hypothetical protein
MKTTILFSVILFYCGSVQSQENDNELSPEEYACGWELLFDGHTLNGWKAYGGDVPKTWMVSENSIYCNGTRPADHIMTVGEYRDFDLKFDWKIQENGNSGVFYRLREGRPWGMLAGFEYQIQDETDNLSKKSTGSIYDVYAPSDDKQVNPAMQWNSGRIRVSRGFVTHWVNGKIVLHCELFSDEWNEKVSESKFKDNQYFGKSPFGHISFQNHGTQVWYKNIKILRL